jgi:hypothetical protein
LDRANHSLNQDIFILINMVYQPQIVNFGQIHTQHLIQQPPLIHSIAFLYGPLTLLLNLFNSEKQYSDRLPLLSVILLLTFLLLLMVLIQ